MRNPTDDMKFPTIDTNNSERPHGKRAGHNKLHMMFCPFCGSRGVAMPLVEGIHTVFTFTDLLSAREYEISGLCQTCQNDTFREPKE